jgi:hypothetical protein
MSVVGVQMTSEAMAQGASVVFAITQSHPMTANSVPLNSDIGTVSVFDARSARLISNHPVASKNALFVSTLNFTFSSQFCRFSS